MKLGISFQVYIEYVNVISVPLYSFLVDLDVVKEHEGDSPLYTCTHL